MGRAEDYEGSAKPDDHESGVEKDIEDVLEREWLQFCIRRFFDDAGSD